MADPHAYEQRFDTHMRRDATSRADVRLLALERRIAELTAELAEREAASTARDTELTALRADRQADRLSLKEVEARQRTVAERLRIATSERDAALREVDRRSSAARELGARIPELEAELNARDEEQATLERELNECERDLGDLNDELTARDAHIADLEADISQLEAEMSRLVSDTGELETEVGTLDAEVGKLQRELEASEAQGQRTVAEYGARVRELEQLVSTLAAGLAQTKADVDRAADSRAWRWGHGATKALRRLALRRNVTEGALEQALKRIEQIETAGRPLPNAASSTSPPATAPPRAPVVTGLDERSEEERTKAREALAAEIRGRLGAVPELASWPPVSIVVPTREGLDHIERLVDGLEKRTDYPEFELIVIDNDSSDETVAFLESLDVPFPVETIANGEPVSFSKANAQGAELARHDLILFLNNDIEPFEPGWLRELVAAHEREGVAAVGATLLRSESGNDPETRDLTVQHRSIKFRAGEGGVRAYNAGDGDQLFEAGFGIEDRSSAVTAACMLVARPRLDAVGGFGEDYRFGTEDVDLGLKLTASGDVMVATGRSILYHRESATQDSEGRDFKRNNRLLNRRIFFERWGPQVRRDYRLGRLQRDRFWTDGEGPHVAITVTSLDPADGWGDWYTAHELGDALGALGWRVTYIERKGDRWYELPQDLDYVISLMDPFDLRRVPAHVTTIIWVRNWTERWLGQPWFSRADVILASSSRSAELIEETTGRQTFPFPLATNPARFAPMAPDPERAADYVFTGNRWGKDRDIQAGLVPRKGERLDIHGKGWDEVPEMAPHARGPAPYADLPAIYSSAKLVLDDTSGPTLPYGAVNSRVFDALAAGTLAITNCESGVRELFGEDFPVWRSPEELREQLDALLGDDERRTQLAKRFRGEVLRRHTYAHRARRLAEILEEHESKLSFCIKIGAPDWEQAERWGDLHFARALERDLRGRGNPCLIQVLDEWEDNAGLEYDVAVVIRGLSRHHPKPGQFNVLWNISHPDEVTGEECDGYDLVCVASEKFAETLGEKTSTPVIVLEQATDPSVFYPDPSPEYEHDLVYVANSRNVLRPIVRDLLPTDHNLVIYGSNWEGLIDTELVVAEYVPNDELRKVYSSARILLCDHWDDMREHGFVSNRIYDALACGATVISDRVPGLERFGDAVRTYESAEELRALIDELLAGNRAPAARQTALVEGEHFSDRIEMLLERVEGLRSPASAGSLVFGRA